MAKTKTIRRAVQQVKNLIGVSQTDPGLQWENVAKSAICLAMLMVPLLVMTWTNDTWELHKLTILLLLMTVAGCAYFVASLRRGSFRWTWHPLDVVVLLLAAMAVIGTFVSVDWWQSLGGVNGWQSHTLPAVLGYVGLYFLIAKTFRTAHDRMIGWISLLTGVGVALLLQMFQYSDASFLPASLAKIPLFSLFGSGLAGGSIMAAFFGGAALLFWHQAKERWQRVTIIAGVTLSWLILLLLGQPIGWAVFIIGMVAVVVQQSRRGTTSMAMTITALALAIAGMVAQFTHLAEYSSLPIQPDVALDQSTSMSVAFQAIWHRPVLGTGPATWFQDFVAYRPASFNQHPEWNVRFIQAGGEWWQIVATKGIVGLGLWWAIMGLATVMLWRQWQQTFAPTVMIGLFWIAAMFLAGFVVTWSLPAMVILWAIIGLNRAAIMPWAKLKATPITPGLYGLGTALVLLAIIFWIPAAGVYASEVALHGAHISINRLDSGATRQANQNILAAAEKKVLNALRLNTRNIQARSFLANLYATDAGIAAQDNKASEVTALTGKTIAQMDQAKRDSHGNPAVYETDNNILNSLSGLIPDVITRAQANFRTLQRIEPSSPIHDVGLGQTLMLERGQLTSADAGRQAGLLQEAIAAYTKAIEKKPDYLQAVFSRALAYVEAGQYDQALTDLTHATPTNAAELSDILTQKGVVLTKLKRYTDAAGILDQAIRANSTNTRAYLAAAANQAAAGDKAKAKTLIEQGLQNIPGDDELTAALATY